MSVHSTYYEDEEEYKRDLAWEYRTEQAGLYHYDDDEIPFEPTCEECEFCKRGLTFCYDVVDFFSGKAPTNDTIGTNCVLKKDLHRQGYVDLCVRDIEHIKEINLFDPVCEDHGELFMPEE